MYASVVIFYLAFLLDTLMSDPNLSPANLSPPFCTLIVPAYKQHRNYHGGNGDDYPIVITGHEKNPEVCIMNWLETRAFCVVDNHCVTFRAVVLCITFCGAMTASTSRWVARSICW